MPLNLVTPYPWRVELRPSGSIRILGPGDVVIATIAEDPYTTRRERLANAYAIAGAARLLADARFLVEEMPAGGRISTLGGNVLVPCALVQNLADAVENAEGLHAVRA